MIIAIDGPAGSGKSTTAKLLASKLNFLYLDTGAMYRAITLHFINNSINLDIKPQIVQSLDKLDLEINFSQIFEIFINKKNVTNLIRNSKIDNRVSQVSKIKIVREKLVSIQRKLSSEKDVVVEGRDIGSKVFPDADFKFFLTADVKERAKRRLNDNQYKNANLKNLIKEIENRDMLDTLREISPLVKVEDAIEIDTTLMTVENQVQKIYDIIKG
tara:strand:- start:1843 stop:2487 length:645 start_codon:yes stop_codon:yes gene_type:complete